MGEVIMIPLKIPPKVQNGTHLGQRYVLRYDPNAAVSERWVWIVKYTVVYDYYGSAATLAAAERAAHRKIKELVNA